MCTLQVYFVGRILCCGGALYDKTVAAANIQFLKSKDTFCIHNRSSEQGNNNSSIRAIKYRIFSYISVFHVWMIEFCWSHFCKQIFISYGVFFLSVPAGFTLHLNFQFGFAFFCSLFVINSCFGECKKKPTWIAFGNELEVEKSLRQ